MATYRGVQASSGTTASFPSGLVAGDTMFLYCCLNNDQALSTPSGWTLVEHNQVEDGSYLWTWLFKKEADSTDVTNGSVTLGTSMSQIGCVAVQDGDVSTSSGNGEITGSNGSSYSFSGMTPSVADSLLIQFWYNPSSRTHTDYAIVTSNPSWTERSDTGGMGIATASRPETTATGNFSVTLSGSSLRASGAICAVAPSTAVGAENVTQYNDTLNENISDWNDTPNANIDKWNEVT